MSILDFKSGTIRTLTMLRIEELMDNRKPMNAAPSMIGFFVDEVEDSGIFKECDDIYPFGESENNLGEFIVKFPTTRKPKVNEYEYYIESLRRFILETPGNNSYWQPVFYTIASLLLCYCFYDLEVLHPETRDANLDKLARRQVLGQMFETLKNMNDSQSKRMYTPMLSIIKKGTRTICEEYFCFVKYYYIELEGKERNKFNTAAERDTAMAKYVEGLCEKYKDTDMYRYLNSVLRQGSDYQVL